MRAKPYIWLSGVRRQRAEFRPLRRVGFVPTMFVLTAISLGGHGADLRSITEYPNYFPSATSDADARLRRIGLSSCAGLREERLPQLVYQILGGNPEALGELYVAFAGDVFEVAYRVLGSAHDAEDITGDVFLGMSTALRSYNHSSSCGFMRWLERITVRLAAARANHIETTKEVPLDSVPAPAARPVATIERLALERALQGVTPALRTVFLLKDVEGYAHHEISAMLGISVAASEVRLHRARRALRSILDDAT